MIQTVEQWMPMAFEQDRFSVGQMLFVVERKEVRCVYFSHRHQKTFHICDEADTVACRPIDPQFCFKSEAEALAGLIVMLEEGIADDTQLVSVARQALERFHRLRKIRSQRSG